MSTPSLGIAYLVQGQAQKEVTANAAFLDLDEVIATRLTKSVAGGATVALTQAEADNAILNLTGAITAHISVTVPNGKVRKWTVENNTTGSFSLTFKTVSGTGVVIPQGWRVELESNGTNVYAPEAAASIVGLLGANGQALSLRQLTEETTIAAAATTDTTIQIPADAQVLAVSIRVTVQPPGTTTTDIGVAGATTRYGTGISTAVNTTTRGTLDGLRYYSAATAIRFTPNATPSNNSGRIRVTIWYMDITPATS